MFIRHTLATVLAILGASHFATAAPAMLSVDERAACNSYGALDLGGSEF
jgi:hypothetical protein